MTPKDYQKEWKMLIHIFVDYLNFKDEYEERHQDLRQQMEKSISQLNKVTMALDQEIQTKIDLSSEFTSNLEQQRLMDAKIAELMQKNTQDLVLIQEK